MDVETAIRTRHSRLPVYRQRQPLATAQQRQQALYGFGGEAEVFGGHVRRERRLRGNHARRLDGEGKLRGRGGGHGDSERLTW